MRDIDRALKACTDAGLVYDPQHKHPRVVDPKTGKFVTFSATPKCPFAHQHMLRDVRRYLGYDVRLKK